MNKDLKSDILGGFAAMLVALPSAIAYGLVIFAPLGSSYTAMGAVGGIIGSVVMGLTAPILGGTPRLISAPCAPAAALLSMFAAEVLSTGSVPVEIIPLYITVIAFGAGIVQIISGAAGGGTFIKYIPYPVVAGFLSGVGILIFTGQLPKFFGIPVGISAMHGLINPSTWNSNSLIIGAVTIAVMFVGPKIIKVVPASIAALSSGIAVYFFLGIFDPKLMSLADNQLVVGSINAGPSEILNRICENFTSISNIGISSLGILVVPIVSLGILLSIDTLKTCLVLDVLTGHRHNSNRELFGQGMANVLSSIAGGMPGSGAMGGTLVNYYSGGKTRLSGMFEGIFALAALVLFARFIQWIPLASLSGVLLVVAVRMIDSKSLRLLRHRSTIFDFAVILAVVLSAVFLSLIAAAGVGIAFAIILFMKNQIRYNVVRKRSFGNNVFSKKKRPASEQKILEERGGETLIVELQGQLFFGTTDQLYSELEKFIGKCRYFILDMRRVHSVDFTAANMLSQIRKKICEKDGMIAFASVPQSVPTGQNVRAYLEDLGFDSSLEGALFFNILDDSLVWAEEEIINEAIPGFHHRKPLDLSEIEFFSGISEETMSFIRQFSNEKNYSRGERIFSMGDKGDEIFFVRKGTVRIETPTASGAFHHLGTFGRGSFFGDLAFLDRRSRSANADAVSDVQLYVLNRDLFDTIAKDRPVVARIFFERLSLEISDRLRINVKEMISMEEN